jgi:hypothetical protein
LGADGPGCVAELPGKKLSVGIIAPQHETIFAFFAKITLKSSFCSVNAFSTCFACYYFEAQQQTHPGGHSPEIRLEWFDDEGKGDGPASQRWPWRFAGTKR